MRSNVFYRASSALKSTTALVASALVAGVLVPASAQANGGTGGLTFFYYPGGAGGSGPDGADGAVGGTDTFFNQGSGGGGGGAGSGANPGGDGGAGGLGGGAGGAGGTSISPNGSNGSNGGGDSGAGGGGGGYSAFSAAAIANPISITGGNGGAGGYATGLGGGGGGGEGGYGAVITGSQINLNDGTISGGTGGAGGGSDSGRGGAGGSGGVGVYFTASGATFENNGTVTGGNGGSGGSAFFGNGAAGAGGVGVVGADLTILNNGSISGGLSANGSTRANALTFTGGANTYTEGVTGSLTGNIGINGGGSLTFDQTANGAEISNGITGDGSVVVNAGANTLTFSGTNTYTGSTTINTGTLSLSGGSAIADTGSVVVGASGTLDLAASETIGALSGAGNVTLNANTLTVAGATDTTFSGSMSGTGGLVKDGTSTFTLSGTNTYSGGTTVSGGMLSATNGGALGSGDVTVETGATLQFAPAGGGTLSNNLNLAGTSGGNGALNVIADGGVAWLTGAVSVETGTSIVTSGNDVVVFSNTVSGTDADLTFDVDAITIINQNLDLGTGTLTMNGTSILALNGGIPSEMGGAVVNSGTLQLGYPAGVANMAMPSDATLTVNGGAATVWIDQTIGSLGGTGGQVYLGSGVELSVGNDDGTSTYAGQVSGAGDFTKAGTGTLTLSGTNTYTGETSVSGGELVVAAGGSIGSGASPSGAITVVSGATLTVEGTIDITGSDLTNAGTVYVASTGTVTDALNNSGFVTNDGVYNADVNNTAPGLITNNNTWNGDVLTNTGTIANGGTWTGSVLSNGGQFILGDGSLITGDFDNTGGAISLLSAASATIGGSLTAGSVAMQNGATTETLTVNGDYVGGGTLSIDADFTADTADQLNVGGNVSGTTTVYVTDVSTGEASGNDVVFASVTGTGAADAFVLGSAVSNGIYVYDIEQSASDYILAASFSGEVDALEALPYTMLLLSDLPTLHQRSGYEDAGYSMAMGDEATAWFMFDTGSTSFTPASSGTGYSGDMDGFRLRGGVSYDVVNTAQGLLTLGANISYGKASSIIATADSSSSIETDTATAALTATWYDASGFYIDGQVQYGAFDHTITYEGVATDVDGKGYSAALEAGKSFATASGWTLTPQARLIYSSVEFDDFSSANGFDVTSSDAESLQAGLGLSADWTVSQADDKAFKVYGSAFVYNELDGKFVTTVEGTDITSELADWSGEITLGARQDFADGRSSVFVEGSYGTTFGDDASEESFSMALGARLAF
jgi:outer membrane autotransporter protein